MKIHTDYDLTKLNTFGIKASAKFFAEVESEEDFKELLNTREFKENDKLFLGGGSNILLTRDFDGLVVLNKITGIEEIKNDEDSVWIRASGGVVWHDLVLYTVEKNYWGIENLALIPGSVGAAPMQNIGAYGSETKDTLEEVEALDVFSGEKRIFKNEECRFGYRDSVFKNELKNKYFITAVVLKLSKKENKNIAYKALSDYLTQNNIEIKTSRDISDAVESIRRSKLPDPKEIGNAGSFFKNVFVDMKKKEELLILFPEMPVFEEEGKFKIPSGWLIEKCGWKGKTLGHVGVYEKQALVLVNRGGATGSEVKRLAEQIISSVYEKFGLNLETEVNLI